MVVLRHVLFEFGFVLFGDDQEKGKLNKLGTVRPELKQKFLLSILSIIYLELK